MIYKIFKHQITIGKVNIESYGLKVYENKSLIHTLYDVSTNYNALSKLVNSLNKNNIEFIHLESILEDFYLDNV